MSSGEFLATFFKEHTYKKSGSFKEYHWYEFSDINADLLTKLIQPYIFNADLEFNKEEKEKIYWVDYNEDEYEAVKEQYLRWMEEYPNSTFVCEMLVQLNIIASCSKEKNIEVAEYIKGKQVIVYCNYLAEIDQIMKLTDCYVMTGDTKNRDEIIEAFTNDNKPLLMTYGVGAYSLNLQFCNEIVYSGINFDYGRVEQSKYRIKRTGQERDIQYTYILADLGINEMIFKNLSYKSTLKEIVEKKIQEGDVKEWLKKL